MSPVGVVLVGAHGHGRWHLDNLRALTAAGRVRLAGICDLTPVDAVDLEGLGVPEQSADLARLLSRTWARVAIVATPIPTHADLTLTAVAHGAHVLLEKPPAATYADFERTLAGVTGSGRVCQVGFQSLGSGAIPVIRRLVAEGAIGRVRGIGAAGAWHRDSSYYARAPWAGRRSVGGVAVADGALTNPFAHALATALAVDGSEGAGDVDAIEVELYRAHPIEADDTGCLRLRTARGTVVTVAVTLCAPDRNEPYLLIHGDRGRITLTYTLDRVELERDGTTDTFTCTRTDLLSNLVDHLDGEAEPLVPLHRTAAFMRVLEAVRTAPDPRPITAEQQHVTVAGGVTRRILPGAAEHVAASAEHLALFSELDIPWAKKDHP
ncbi:Gfo/Idh/MocA family oxidoreductase [Actinomadura kijaniata]|uniref:Putative dehydrogenase n=1 Tax=Actinomadura namibiensis TaxID=182080 RepID=A0A7W3LZT4_ACTNM|nr:Gfo/Idh/MocA family oxidoreductase [Actinomadura namibiensis]MBA8957232.1 putative dehydrogenase [Actinomadura namibiensis]